jgi:hypothetical protein
VEEVEEAEPIEAEDAEDGSVCDDIDDGEVQGTNVSNAEEEAAEETDNRTLARQLGF